MRGQIISDRQGAKVCLSLRGKGLSLIIFSLQPDEHLVQGLGPRIAAHSVSSQLLNPVAGRSQRTFSLGRRTAGVAQGLIGGSHALACGLMGKAGLGGGGRELGDLRLDLG